MNDWKTPRPTEQCAGCRHVFEPGETVRAFLYEASTGYERRDYCADCLPADDRQAVGSWRTRRPVLAARRRTAFDAAAAYELFQQLEDDAEPARTQLRFLLALLLWRKRVLKLARTCDETGCEYWEFRDLHADVTHRVRRPALAEEELDQLSSQLEQLVSGELRSADVVGTDRKPESVHD